VKHEFKQLSFSWGRGSLPEKIGSGCAAYFPKTEPQNQKHGTGVSC